MAAEETIQKSLKELGSLLDNEMQPITPEQASDPLIRTLKTLGNTLQLSFVFPKPSSKKNLQERIHDIAIASQINFRQITLPPRWWKDNHGPLLAFLSNTPVALLPNSQGHYQVIKPNVASPINLTDELASQINPQAIIFYRSFPPKEKLTSRDILDFCLFRRKKDLLTIFLVSLTAAILSLFLPIANQILFDYIIPYRDTQLFGQLLLGIALILLSTSAFSAIKEYSVLKVETFLNHDMETALWDRLLNLPANLFRNFTVGDLLQRVSAITIIRQTLSGNFVRLYLNAIFSLIYLAIMFYYSPALTIISIAFLALSFIITAFGYTAIKKRAKQYLIGIINGKVIQMIMGLSKIRTNGAEQRFFRYWAKDAMTNQQLQLQMGSIANHINTADVLLDNAKYLMIFLALSSWVAGATFFTPMISLGAYLAFNVALVNLASAVAEFNAVILQLPGVSALWQYAKVLLKVAPENKPNTLKLDQLKGAIRIENLRFRYDPNGPWIHDDISLDIKPGEFVAIVGPSGCGKSSLIRLLLGFESPQQGTILYDNHDLANLDLRNIRSHLSCILQNSKIMDGTIRDNITAGHPYPLEEIMAAITLAAFDDDLKQFPMGLQTALTSGGTTISGGQRQRLFLARAFLSKAPVMLWDEATAGIDNIKQQFIMDNLKKINATRIIIAHRLAAAIHADRIYVLSQGKIVETGTYTELSQRKGLFAEMLSRQAL